MNAVIEAMAQRRSCKKYLPKPVPMELLEEIAQAGTYAPNGMGRQSGKIVILTDPEEIAAIEAVNAGILGNPAGHPFYGAPAVLVVLANQAIPTWDLARAGSTGHGRPLRCRKEKRCWRNGALAAAMPAWDTVLWGTRMETPGKLPHENQILW